MSPVIYREDIEPPVVKCGPKCGCPITTKYFDGEPVNSVPTEPVGSIWECDNCGKLYISSRETVWYYPRWKRVRPWHHKTMKKIKDLSANNSLVG